MNGENNKSRCVNSGISQGSVPSSDITTHPCDGTEPILGQYVSNPTPYEDKYRAWLFDNPSKGTVNQGDLACDWSD